jgi:uncharacterized membrane protein/mono/diheme cytochrome c family protein
MTLKNYLPSFLRLIGLALIASNATIASAQDKADFVKDIKPIFEKNCVVCHGPVEKEDEENDFRIDVREDALDFIGTDGADESDLFYLIVSDDDEEMMPPPEHSKLTPEQITLVKTWIDEGADWPEGIEMVDTSETKDEDVDESEDPKPTVEPQDDEKQDDEKQEENKDADAVPILTTDKKTQQVFDAMGSLHPAAVHLPIGLLLASGLFALFSLRGNFVMSDCAYYCLWLGTLGAIAACVSGWWYSPMEHRGDVAQFGDLFDQTQDVFWHRTGGLIITAVALLLALFAAGARNRDPDDGVLWKLGLILLACGIGWVGHTGGELAYPSQYKDLNAIYERIIGGDQLDAGEDGNKDVPAKPEDADVGKSSGESEAKPDAPGL